MNYCGPAAVRSAATTWRWAVSEGVMLRIGGLDYAAIDAMVSAEVSAALSEEQRLADRCVAIGETLTEALFAAIHVKDRDRVERNVLLSVKRDIYNGRRPGDAAMALCVALLPAEIERCAGEWLAAHDALERHRGKASVAAAGLRDAGRQELQRLVAQSDFRLGLLTSSPALEMALERYAVAAGGALNRKVRHIEEAVVSYVYRTACKTSPFSRLTPVCFGIFGDEAALVPPLEAAISADVRPNMSLLGRLRQLIILNLTKFPDLEVTIQDKLASSGRHLSYRRRVETVLHTPGPIHASAKEFSFNLKRTTALGAVVESLADKRALRVRDLLKVLEDALMTDAQARHFLQLLADKGLLKPAGLHAAVLDGACWQRFRDQLRRADDPWLQATAQAIDEVLDDARAYATGGVAERRTLIARMGAKLDALVGALAPDERAPRPIVYEDATLSRTPVVLGRAEWNAAIDDLPTLHRFLSLYDPLLLSRLTLKAMFVQRYGRGGTCNDISAFSDEFHDGFYTAYASQRRHDGRDSFGTGRLNAAHAPVVALIEQARARVRDFVAAASVGGASEIELPDRLVCQIGDLAAPFQDLLSNAFYLQFATVDGRRSVVLNRTYGGAGSSFSRFATLFRQGDEAGPIEALLRGNAACEKRKGGILAEFQGGYDTNLNQHVLSTPAEIVFPGERPAGSADGRIGVEELSLRHNPLTDKVRLYCERLGREVTPVYAGMFYPLALPELQALLMHFSYPVQLKPDLFGDGDEPERFLPRVRYGNVVVQRAKWILPANTLPLRQPLDDEYARLSRYHDWRRGRGLPRMCFAQVFERGGAGGAPGQKPSYLDFESPFALDVLEKANVNRSGVVELTEALPGPGDSVVTVAGEPRVAEFVVEITQETPS